MADSPSHIGRRHIHFASTDSTNDRAAELAHDPAAAGTIVTTDVQSQGRGQHGRTWQSVPGQNVLLSALLFPPSVLRQPAVLTAWAAVVVSETVLQLTDCQPSIKWPNDVLVGGKKISGILIECGLKGSAAGVEVGRVPHFVVGIGLNVNQSAEDFARQGLPDATSLAAIVDHSFEVPAVTRRLIDNLDVEYGRLLGGNSAGLEFRWTQRIGLVARPVTVELMDGTEVRGRLIGLGFEGLVLEPSDGAVRRFPPEAVRHVR